MLRINDEELEFDEYNICRYQGNLFSGVGFELYPDKSILSETTYVGGFQDGLERFWDNCGRLRGEGTRYQGGVHGVWRGWHESGRLHTETLCEFGLIISEMEWDEDGALKRAFDVDPHSAGYEIILVNRDIHRRGRK